MIAAEDELLERKTGSVGDVFDEAAEGGGLHTGVAAVLIDLVAGGFDEEKTPVGDCLLCRGAEHKRMRAADGVDAGGRA